MRHADHVNLLRPANLQPGGKWADLGAGSGAFTLALRELIGPTARIHAVDKDGASLRELERAYEGRFGEANSLRLQRADLSGKLELPPLDGALMANSLHFFKDQVSILRRVGDLLKRGGQLLIVEYNSDQGNPWVPHPLSFKRFEVLAEASGFAKPRLVATHPSSFMREIYSAQSLVATGDRTGH